MRLIDADALRDGFLTQANDAWNKKAMASWSLAFAECADCVEEAPTVDPVKHGRWDLIDGCEPVRYGCSACHRMVWHHENYCPNCGAKMDEEADHDDHL